MKKVILLSMLLFGFFASVSGQQRTCQSIQDFLVNEENTPSSFQQRNVSISAAGSNHYIAAWEDSRNGDWGFYAQEFDADGNFVGGNFPIASNLMVSAKENAGFLAIDYQMIEYFDWHYINIRGNFYDEAKRLINSSVFAVVSIPWCGTGYLGYDYQCVNSTNQYIFLLRDNGSITLRKYDALGNLLFRRADTLGNARMALDAALAANARGDYSMICVRIDGETFQNRGIFGSFYDERDSVLVENRLLEFPVDSTVNGWHNRGWLHAIALPDTSYLFFATYFDSSKIYYRKFDRYGQPQSELRFVQIPGTVPVNVINFSFSTLYNGKSDLLVSNRNADDDTLKQWNILYTFDRNGILTGTSSIDSSHLLRVGGTMAKISDSTSFAGSDDGKDAYLTKLRLFSPIASTKLNDDQSGSNETMPAVFPANTGSFVALWNNEVGTFAQRLNLSGEKIGVQMPLEGSAADAFSDGSFLNLWRKTNAGAPDSLGFTIYGDDWTLLRRSAFAADNSADIFSTIPKVLSDSTFLIVLQEGYNDARMLLFNREGLIQKESRITSANNVYNIRVSTVDDSSFWVLYGTKARLYSTRLNQLSQEMDVNAQLYLGGDRFLSIWYDLDALSSQKKWYGTIFTSDGDTLQKRIFFVATQEDITAGRLGDGKFMLVIKKGNSLFARSFSDEGMIIRDSLDIRTSASGNIRTPAFCLENGKVFFVWSEIRSPSPGYSIYGSIMDSSIVTDIRLSPSPSHPFQSALLQNYPNPFNPSTVISYRLPDVGTRFIVSLKVYDILGREVVTLVEGQKEAGYYTVRFDGLRFASGVYFARFVAKPQNGKQIVQVKKMLLLR
jgi:hypothetical protein